MDHLKEEELEEVVSLLKTFLEESPGKTKQHEEEHAFIRQIMEEYQKRIEFWDSVQKKVVSTGILALLSAVLSAVGFTVMHWLKGDL